MQGMTIANGTIERKKHNLYMEVGNDKWKGVVPDTIGQYTGVDDINGKHIFEGDIVHFTFKNLHNQDRNAYVFYKDGEWMCQSSDRECNPTCLFPGYKAGIFDIEVIGNIYDSPELLD
ncbi:MAG: hypothetical protein HDR73_09010 [Clavibacter sp.]|nr:hypothetical protein [Clavibacter sp.]